MHYAEWMGIYFATISSRFISADGLTCWMNFSEQEGTGYPPKAPDGSNFKKLPARGYGPVFVELTFQKAAGAAAR